jgi:transposase-like protein
MGKKDLELKKELAKHYYMTGENQKAIAAKIDVTEATVSRWAKAGAWAAKRAGANITRPELVNKNLLAINSILDDFNSSDDPNKELDADKICKLAKVIENLDKKASVVDAIDVFMAFNRWMQFRMSFDREVTPELIQAINKYQDLYITENITSQWLPKQP